MAAGEALERGAFGWVAFTGLGDSFWCVFLCILLFFYSTFGWRPLPLPRYRVSSILLVLPIKKKKNL